MVGFLLFENDGESIKLLYQREGKREYFSGMDSGELKIILKEVSDLFIYVGNKNPEFIVDEIF